MTFFQQESERLRFRKLTIDDIENWVDFFENNDRIHFLGLDPAEPAQDLAALWINKQLERYERDELGMLAVIEKQSGDFIGQCGILSRTIEDKAELEIAYSLKPKYWKQGYGTEMAKQMRKFGTAQELTERFISIIHKDNQDSMRVAEKNGMKVLFESHFMGMDVFIFGG